MIIDNNSYERELADKLIVVARNMRNFTMSASIAGAEVCEDAARHFSRLANQLEKREPKELNVHATKTFMFW